MKCMLRLLDFALLGVALVGCATTLRDPWEEKAEPSRWASQPPMHKPYPCDPSFGECARNHPEVWPVDKGGHSPNVAGPFGR